MQNDLFDVGADLCTPVVPDPKYPPLRIEQEYVDRLEGWCDHYNAELPTLRSFILNGGTAGAAQLHVARTVARRAERAAWAAYEEHGEAMNKLAIPTSTGSPTCSSSWRGTPTASRATCCGCPEANEETSEQKGDA